MSAAPEVEGGGRGRRVCEGNAAAGGGVAGLGMSWRSRWVAPAPGRPPPAAGDQSPPPPSSPPREPSPKPPPASTSSMPVSVPVSVPGGGLFSWVRGRRLGRGGRCVEPARETFRAMTGLYGAIQPADSVSPITRTHGAVFNLEYSPGG